METTEKDKPFPITPEVFVYWLQELVKEYHAIADKATDETDATFRVANRTAALVLEEVIKKYSYVMPPPALLN